MSEERQINLKVNVETNDSAIENAKRRLREIETAQADLAKSILNGSRTIASAEGEIESLNKEYQTLNKTLRQTGDTYETVAQEAKRVAREQGAIQQARGIRGATDRFDRVSNDVGLAGDIESSGRAIGGAIGAFGGAGAERAIGQGAELFAVAEALPRLKVGLAGLPATLGAAATALGPVGLALTALAAVAAAVAFAISKSSEELGKVTTAQFDSQRSIDQAVAGGSLDTAQAQARLQELKTLIDRENALKLEAERQYQAASFNILDQGFNQQEEALFNQTETSKNLLRDYQAEVDVLNKNLEAGTIPAAQAAQSTTALASAVQSLGRSAQSSGAQVASAGRRQGESRNEFLNRQDKEQRAEERRLGAIRSQQQRAEREARSQARKERIRAIREEARQERESQAEEARNAQEQQAKLSQDFQRNEVKAAVDQYRTLERIREDALQSEQEAIREGSIFAIRDIREKANRDLARSADDFEATRQDRLVDFRTQFAELLASINPSAAQGQFSAINQFQQGRTGASNITINANGLNLPQARTLVQTELARTYR